MTQLEYYLGLRAELFAIVAKVKDAASWDLFFYPTNSNLATKASLERLYNKYKESAVCFGLVQVTRHISCPNSKHIEYITSNAYGLDIKDQDEDYVWGKYQSHDTRKCVCPCSAKNKATTHSVLDEIIYPVSKQIPCAPIFSILAEIRSAVHCSSSNRPRSGIRCHIFMAIMKIDNQLIPGGVANYLDHLKDLSRQNI